MDEASLISRAAQGEAAAWEPVVLAHQEAIFRLAYLILGDPDEAEDVAQETFVRAWKNLRRFDARRPLRPWLFRIAANAANNRRRSAGRYLAALVRTVQAEAETPSTEEQGTQRIESQQLWKAVQQLAQADQQIIYLRYFLDLSVAETAETLEMAEGTVKSRCSRALERLRSIVRRDLPTLGDEQAR